MSEFDEIRKRVIQLERALRIVLVSTVVFVLLLTAFLSSKQTEAAPQTLKVRSIEVVDQAGKTGIKLWIIGTGPMIEVASSSGTTRVVLSGGASTIWIYDKSQNIGAAMGVDLDGGWIKLGDARGKTVFQAPR